MPSPTPKSHNPFGSPLIGRNFEAENERGYRFGFNGKENIDEIYVEGNGVDFGARILDGRLGRWLSVDPLTLEYPSQSPYNNCLDNPIIYLDYTGKEIIIHYKEIIINANGTSETVDRSFKYRPGITPPENQFVISTVRALDKIHLVNSKVLPNLQTTFFFFLVDNNGK